MYDSCIDLWKEEEQLAEAKRARDAYYIAKARETEIASLSLCLTFFMLIDTRQPLELAVLEAEEVRFFLRERERLNAC